jgi:hypothetical protein
MKGTSKRKLPAHLAEYWFRSKHPKDCTTVFREIFNLFKNFKYNY